MCGRLNVIDDPVSQAVWEQLGLKFHTKTNRDLRPSESVSSLAGSHGALIQQDLQWGIQPEWAKRLIINAQAETVAVKPTFHAAFQQHRVVVPCCGWYEWQARENKKHKFLFRPSDQPIGYMAGIATADNRLVTLTTEASGACLDYHHRMPVMLLPQEVPEWILSDASRAQQLLLALADQHYCIEQMD
ncbi:SOS response-associated peptidase [Vibrio sp.]|uniref:SOS response-associated peptidase n=1 Tax=Vibrio sp. TaxID=678 RepID=UPI003D0C064A